MGIPAPSVDWRHPWQAVAEVVVIASTALLPLLLFTNVVARYTGWFRTAWTLDAARACFMWASFLGAALGVKYGAHVRIALLSDRIARAHNGRYRYGVLVGIHGSVLLVGLLLGVVGWDIVEISMNRTMSGLRIRRGYVDAAVPIGGALMAFYSAKAIWQQVRDGFHHD